MKSVRSKNLFTSCTFTVRHTVYHKQYADRVSNAERMKDYRKCRNNGV
jgi:hypothetical protein